MAMSEREDDDSPLRLARRSTEVQATFKALREKLKLDARTKPSMLAAAVDLARNTSLQPAKVCEDRKLPPGSHTRAKALRDRILAAGLLALCSPDTHGQEVASQPACAAGLSEHLLVQTHWASEHTPNVEHLKVAPFSYSADANHATRGIVVKLFGLDEPLHTGVELPARTVLALLTALNHCLARAWTEHWLYRARRGQVRRCHRRLRSQAGS